MTESIIDPTADALSDQGGTGGNLDKPTLRWNQRPWPATLGA